jgi:hypothetical protein
MTKAQWGDLAGTVLLPLLGVIAAWISLRSPRLGAMGDRSFARFAVAAWIATRVGGFLAAYVVLDYRGTNDLLYYWFPAGKAVLEGRDPQWILSDLYGPALPWLLAGGVWVGGGSYPPAAGLAFVAADALSLVVLHRITSPALPTLERRQVLLLTLFSPFTWFAVVVRSQDEALVSLALLLAILCVRDRRDLLAGVVVAVGTACTKVLFPVLVFPVLLSGAGGWRGSVRRVGIAGLLTLPVLLLSVSRTGGRATNEVTVKVAGASTWSLFLEGSKLRPGTFAILIVLTVAVVVVVAVAVARRFGAEPPEARAARGCVGGQGAFLVLAPLTHAFHMAHALPLLAWQAVAERTRGAAGGAALATGLLAWQIPGCIMGSNRWHGREALIVPWALWWSWTVYKAVTSKPGVYGDRAGGDAADAAATPATPTP